MNSPVSIDLPHSLGAEEAKQRMQKGAGQLKDFIPGGNAQVVSRWEGNRMYLDVRAMGQEVTGHIDVEETKVHLELMLPAFLALFANKIERLVRSRGGELLEDKSKSGGAQGGR